MILALATDPARALTIAEVQREVADEETDVLPAVTQKRLEIRLRELAARGLVAIRDERYQYLAGAHDGHVAALLAFEDEDRALAARLVYAVPRLSGAEAFADAFNWPKRSA